MHFIVRDLFIVCYTFVCRCMWHSKFTVIFTGGYAKKKILPVVVHKYTGRNSIPIIKIQIENT